MRLFCSIDTSALAAVMFVLVILVMTVDSTPLHGPGPDLARVSHPVSMRGALREDAMLVAMSRNGDVYFGRDKILPIDLPARIGDLLKDPSVERKVYLRVDARCRYRTVKEVLNAIHAAGVENVAFLVDQRRVSP